MTKYKRKAGYVSRNVKIHIPDRAPDEDDITPNQIRYLNKLAPDVNIDGGLESLGKWQASGMIDEIKDQQEKLEYDIARGKAKSRSKLKSLFWMVVLILIIYMIIKHVLS